MLQATLTNADRNPRLAELQAIFDRLVSQDEQRIGQFSAMQQPSNLLRLFMGPLSALMFRQYYITVTDKKIYFSRLSMWSGKIDTTDPFVYEEIEKATIKTGRYMADLKFKFKNGNSLKLRSPYRKELQAAQKTDIKSQVKAELRQRLFLNEKLANYLKERLM